MMDNVKERNFISIYQNGIEDRIKVESECGAGIELGSVGAGIRSLTLPVGKGSRNIVLSFADESAWADNDLYADATLAPFAGRIAGARLPLRGRMLNLCANDHGAHTLHGGENNASFARWTLDAAGPDEDSENAMVVFSLSLPDGTDGFPGNRSFRTIYRFGRKKAAKYNTLRGVSKSGSFSKSGCSKETDYDAPRGVSKSDICSKSGCSNGEDSSCTLQIRWEAESDRDSFFNLSNHSYFNLSGDFSSPVYDHELMIRADQFAANDPDFLPSSVISVEESPFDFRMPVRISENLNRFPNDPQIRGNRGYNHAFILTKPHYPSALPALRLISPDKALTMEAFSDCPAMVLYSGGYFPHASVRLKEENGRLLLPGSALAFEFQNMPVVVHEGIQKMPVCPGRKLWSKELIYRFSWQ